MKINKIEKFEKIFNKFTNLKKIHESVLFIENTSGDFSFSKSYGGKELDSPLLMASITKLFTTTCILVLQEQGKLSLDDKITKYFNNSMLRGLHVYYGKEYSFDLTLSDLMFQTSGLPDIFEEGKASTKNKIVKKDFCITFEETVECIKKVKPHFAPRTKRKAYYSDINFDMLGKIVERVNGTTLMEAYEKFIFFPLGLKKTYLIENEDNVVPNIYYKNTVLKRPKYLSCCGSSGGGVTTASEMMIFIKAFFGGKLFNKAIFGKLSIYRKLQFLMGPIRYGGGYMQVPLSGVVTLFSGEGELVGHTGSTGSFAFYYPQKDLFFVGDLNQMGGPSLPIRISMQLAMAAK
ncbi:serine hydrolase domain-containing protein [Clostridium sp. MB05]